MWEGEGGGGDSGKGAKVGRGVSPRPKNPV